MALQAETFEALCSAFYRMPFVEFLGEGPTLDAEQNGPGHAGFFHFGEKPTDMRITVVRRNRVDEVDVLAEWRNMHADPRNPLHGMQRFTVITFGKDQTELGPATESVVLRVLEMYQQVLAGTGIAGDISLLYKDEDSHGVNSEDDDSGE